MHIMTVDTQQDQIKVLFEQYHEPMKRYLVALTQNIHDAEEIIQEAYLKLLQQKNEISANTGNVKAYLYKTVTNLAIDRSRKEVRQHRHQHYSIDDMEITCTAPNPQSQVYTQQVVNQLEKLLNDVSPRCRKVFYLHRIKQKNYQQIAAELNITTRTVERDMHVVMAYCREKLQELL